LVPHAGLSLEPLIGAIAAGNAVALKPSELSPCTSRFLADNIGRYMDNSAVKVVQGGPEVGEQLMEHRWDKVLFTGKLVKLNVSCVLTIEKCARTHLNANPMVEVVRAHALKGKKKIAYPMS
jgi:delta 1-pyrroline-5-carboxylate dehydrogenase